MESERIYVAVDLKSFYASVECVERSLDPLTTNLVVADKNRTNKTICLAVSPSLKACGIPGRPRLFEVVQKVKEINAVRQARVPGKQFSGASPDAIKLKDDLSLAVDYLVAQPRMALYLEYSLRIYKIYLQFIAPEDIHVYSIDEVFMDVTGYLDTYHLTARELAGNMIREVFSQTGITAAAGIGTNLYLAKVAMDIVAKHVEPDENGMRIAELDEMTYRRLLWNHRPLTDFWRVGRGYAEKLEEQGLFTMGDIARCSMGESSSYYNEKLLYKMFGVNAELLMDHAWGREPCTMSDIKKYKPGSSSIGSGQVLQQPYPFNKARLIVQEMADLLALDLVEKKLVTDQIVLTVGYDRLNLTDPGLRENYQGPVKTDHYGRRVPKHAHGTVNLDSQTSSAKQITDAALQLFDRIVNPKLLVRRVSIAACRVLDEASAGTKAAAEQLDLFTDYEELERKRQAEKAALERERKLQQVMIEIKRKFGKNAILKGMNLQEGAMTVERNRQIGGHKA